MLCAPRDHACEAGQRLAPRSEEVQDIARAREAAGGVASMQIGSVTGKGMKCKDVKGKVKSELMQVEKGES